MDNPISPVNPLLPEGGDVAISVVVVVFYVLVAVALWKVFSKAGYPGILALIPIVNIFVLVKIAGYSAWLTLLFVVPLVNIVFSIMVSVKLGERFGKGAFFSIIFLWLLSVIGCFILGFGAARYRKA